MADDPNDYVRVSVLMPRWVKDELRKAADEVGLPVSTYSSYALVRAARDTIGVPEPPPASAPVPTVSDVLRAYVEGNDDRLIGPCGERWPCGYDPDSSKYIGKIEFCDVCNVRVG